MNSLEIQISADLEELVFSEMGITLGKIIHPRLLWECSCNPMDGGRSPAQGNCILHALDNAQRISSLFGHATRIRFHDVSIVWDGYGWPPSIDSIFLVKTVLDTVALPSNIKTIWDMGAGTGFLGLVLTTFIKSVKFLKAVEIDPKSASICQDNLNAHIFNHDVKCEVINESIFDLDPNTYKPGDFIIANPPYLPLPDDVDKSIPFNSSVSGTAMLEYIIKLTAIYRLNAIICYSSLAQEEVDSALRASGSVGVNLLAERYCPLRLNLPADYIEWLIQNRNLLQRSNDVFEYWHNIRVISLYGSNE